MEVWSGDPGRVAVAGGGVVVCALACELASTTVDSRDAASMNLTAPNGIFIDRTPLIEFTTTTVAAERSASRPPTRCFLAAKMVFAMRREGRLSTAPWP